MPFRSEGGRLGREGVWHQKYAEREDYGESFPLTVRVDKAINNFRIGSVLSIRVQIK